MRVLLLLELLPQVEESHLNVSLKKRIHTVRINHLLYFNFTTWQMCERQVTNQILTPLLLFLSWCINPRPSSSVSLLSFMKFCLSVSLSKPDVDIHIQCQISPWPLRASIPWSVTFGERQAHHRRGLTSRRSKPSQRESRWGSSCTQTFSTLIEPSAPL